MQMDKMVNTLQDTNSEFAGKYFQAREIIDLGKSHNKITGTTKDKDNSDLSGVLIKLTLTDDSKILYDIKADKGIIPITYIKPNTYDISVEYPSFQTIKETNVQFIIGKTIKRNYVLIP